MAEKAERERERDKSGRGKITVEDYGGLCEVDLRVVQIIFIFVLKFMLLKKYVSINIYSRISK